MVIGGNVGCASKQELADLRSQLNDLKADVREIQQGNSRLAEFEQLKVAREEKVRSLNNIAEALATVRAWDSEVKAFDAHRKANEERHMLLVRQMQSPDKARNIGPTEGHLPYAGSFQEAYTRFLPTARAEVFDLLDRETVSLKDRRYFAAVIRGTAERAWDGLSYDYPGREAFKETFDRLREFTIEDAAFRGPTSERLASFRVY